MVPKARNEAVLNYAPRSAERASLKAEIKRQRNERVEIASVIGGTPVFSETRSSVIAPHNHRLILADQHAATERDVATALASARKAAPDWAALSFEDRAAIFLKAAELVSGARRFVLNAATMLGQSKTAHQAEIDAAAELADFLRFNVQFAEQIYKEQPLSVPGVWNRADYRPLEGFVYAVTPFNFTAIAGNLPTAPALMGNVVIWKPSLNAALSAHYVMQLLIEAGLPDGVINVVYGDPQAITRQVLAQPDFAGLHFTGSTAVFNHLWQMVAANLATYRSYPRLVGETGGKNFILAHDSADEAALVTAIIRGGFEYQGQKCSAASRVFAPRSLWQRIRSRLVDEIQTIRMGDVEDFSMFMGAVINRQAFERHMAAIAEARALPSCQMDTSKNLPNPAVS